MDNYETILQDLETYGRGGTDLQKGICEGVEKIKEEYPEELLRGIIYATDLGDSPPAREDLPEVLPPVVFITTAEYMNDRFSVGVSDYATVVSMEAGNTIDLIAKNEDADELEYNPF
jgi:uncharacterized protein with von Willebrand factor type A (vWA) domain